MVTGARRYASDQHIPNMRYGAVLRPPVRGATLRAAEIHDARRMPGVTVVRDGDFVGVTAPDLVTARRAVAAIGADWDVPAAIADPMPDYLRSHPAPGQGRMQPVDHGRGDTGAALADAAIAIEASYTTAYLAHVPLETRAAVAEWADARLTVWTGNNVPFPGRQRLRLGHVDQSQRVGDAPVAQLDDGLPEQVVGPVEVIQQHLVRRAGRPRGTPEREVHQAVDREVVDHPVQQVLPPGLAAWRPRRPPVPRPPRRALIHRLHGQTSFSAERYRTAARGDHRRGPLLVL